MALEILFSLQLCWWYITYGANPVYIQKKNLWLHLHSHVCTGELGVLLIFYIFYYKLHFCALFLNWLFLFNFIAIKWGLTNPICDSMVRWQICFLCPPTQIIKHRSYKIETGCHEMFETYGFIGFRGDQRINVPQFPPYLTVWSVYHSPSLPRGTGEPGNHRRCQPFSLL